MFNSPLASRKIERISLPFCMLKPIADLCMHAHGFTTGQKKNCGKSGLDQRTRGCWTMDLLLAKPTLPLLENVLPSSFPTHLAMPCTSPHTESNCRQDGAWSNFCQIKKQRCQAKRQKTSETEQENSRKFESNKRKRAFYPSWKESFCSSSIMLHVRQ